MYDPSLNKFCRRLGVSFEDTTVKPNPFHLYSFSNTDVFHILVFIFRLMTITKSEGKSKSLYTKHWHKNAPFSSNQLLKLKICQHTTHFTLRSDLHIWLHYETENIDILNSWLACSRTMCFRLFITSDY